MKLVRIGVLALLAACAPSGPMAKPTASYAGPIIDVHTHVIESGDDPVARQGTRPLHLVAMRAAGISGSVVLPIAPKGDLGKTRELNDAALAFARLNPGLLDLGRPTAP